MDNPEEIEKIEVEEQVEAKNVDLQPENTENNEKLKQMDALVASYIAECYADAEKNAKNTEKIAQQSENLHTNAQKSENLHTNAQISTQTHKIARAIPKNAQNCTWNFSGEQIRIILRRSLIKNVDLAKAVHISRNKLVYLMRSEAFPQEITKILAQMIGLNSPEELQEYYDNIPEDVKESVRLDARIYRPIKPGVYIPPEVYLAAREVGKVAELFSAADARAGR